MDSTNYLKWLQLLVSRLFHTLSDMSWSMVESLSCGTHLIASDIAATREICANIDGVTFVDHRDRNKIVHGISEYFSRGSRISYYSRDLHLRTLSQETSLKEVKLIGKAHTER